jgi:hypothetical protein
MTENMTIRYQLTSELWRSFFEAHYSSQRSLRLRYLWGVVCIVIGCLGFAGYYASALLAALLLATGFFAVLSKPLLVGKSLRSAGRHPFFGKELVVTAGPAALAVRSGSAGYSQPWNNFRGYRRLRPGFLLYHDRNAFFFIPSAALTAVQAERLESFLAAAGVPKLPASSAGDRNGKA